MKKTILISSLLIAITSLTAYGFVSLKNQQKPDKQGCVKVDDKGEKALCSKPIEKDNNGCKPKSLIDQALFDAVEEKEVTDFTYRVGSRFITTITKSDLANAQTIYDIYPQKATEDKKAFNDNKLALLADGGNISAYGNGIELTEEQKQLFQKMNYSDNFYLHVDCSYEFGESGYTNEEYIIYYVTIVPEQEAEYKSGETAFIDYLKTKSSDYIQDLDSKKLRPGKLAFDINTDGQIENVKLEHTCGYNNIDQRMMDILNNVPGEWTPAKDAEGNPVAQTYLFDFGMVGC